jgi:hypothetical protein
MIFTREQWDQAQAHKEWGRDRLAEELHIGTHAARKMREMMALGVTPSIIDPVGKKEPVFDWREWSTHLQQRQVLTKKASGSNDTGTIRITTDKDYIIFRPLADMHIGSIATDYEAFREFTDQSLKSDNTYLALIGDQVDNFVNFKNMLAVHQQILSPEQQYYFIQSWIAEVERILMFITWGNHEAFEEGFTGMSAFKRLYTKRAMYFNGLATVRVFVNDIEYKIVATHKARFHSSFNKTHGLKQLARKEIPDADIYVEAHYHDPDMEQAWERGMDQIFLNLGSLKVDDGYAKRYFSCYSSSVMPCVVLGAKNKSKTPFWTLADAQRFCQVKD